MNSDQGDWFFEELISLNANQNELLRIISEAAPSFYNHIEVDDIRLTATIYQTLGRLHREWKSYIIPESVTLVQIEESTQLVDAGFLIRVVQTLPAFWWQRLLQNEGNVATNIQCNIS